jgi:hypothetical protein
MATPATLQQIRAAQQRRRLGTVRQHAAQIDIELVLSLAALIGAFLLVLFAEPLTDYGVLLAHEWLSPQETTHALIAQHGSQIDCQP